jgi:hypothetical protein
MKVYYEVYHKADASNIASHEFYNDMNYAEPAPCFVIEEEYPRHASCIFHPEATHKRLLEEMPDQLSQAGFAPILRSKLKERLLDTVQFLSDRVAEKFPTQYSPANGDEWEATLNGYAARIATFTDIVAYAYGFEPEDALWARLTF